MCVREEGSSEQHASEDRVGVVLNALAAHLHRALHIAALEERFRELDEDHGRGVGLEDLLELFDEGFGHRCLAPAGREKVVRRALD